MNDDLSKQLTGSMKQSLLDATKKLDKTPEVQIGHEEFQAMKKAKYSNADGANIKSYTIQNTKTKAIVEIKAVSSMIAAKTVGWRPRHCKVLGVTDNE